MKKFTLIFIFLISTFVIGQNKKATIFLRDGSEMIGYARLHLGSDKVVFRDTISKKKKTYDYRSIKKIIIEEKTKTDTYTYKIIKGFNKPRLALVIIDDTLSLFGVQQPGGSINGEFSLPVTVLYLGKKNESQITNFEKTRVGERTKYWERASDFFKDCSKALDKIEKKEFAKRDLKAMLEFYNAHCD